MAATDYLPENTEHAMREWGQVVRGHDALHPDRSDCGGVGGCALMRAEHDAEQRVVELLERLARRGATYRLTVAP